MNRWRKLAETKRVGHLGTLDPMATGLLILVTGTATRLAQFMNAAEKTYRAEILLGVVSNTYDADGVTKFTNVAIPDSATVSQALDQFRGTFFQTPPPVSAKKVNGIPAYKLARKNEVVELKAVEVTVSNLEPIEVSADRLIIQVTCSAGTYIRSIAQDLGQLLGCGAILTSLRRLCSGVYSVANAHTLDSLTALAAADRLSEVVIPSPKLLPEFPSEYVNETVEAQIRQGRMFRTSPFVVQSGAQHVKAISYRGDLIAIGTLKIPNLYHPGVVL